MYEVELKVPADVDRVRERLDELGAERIDALEQADTYYDAPHRDFAETDEAVRIRHERDGEESTTKVTYKGPRVNDASKTRKEFETAVAERDALEGILGGIGFETAAVVRKERERYALDDLVVTLDVVEDVGTFVEVETEVESEDDIEAARRRGEDLLERLDLDPDDQVLTSYLGLSLDASE